MIKKFLITIAVIYLCIFMFHPFWGHKKMKGVKQHEK